jgi:hypothetical protein
MPVLRKYLARFDLTWSMLRDRSPDVAGDREEAS